MLPGVYLFDDPIGKVKLVALNVFTTPEALDNPLVLIILVLENVVPTAASE